MDVVKAVFNPTPGQTGGVNQGEYMLNGNDWIRKHYPGIQFITSANITK